MSPTTILKDYDLIVVGAGAAGLSTVLEFLRSCKKSAELLPHKPNVLVISKLQALRSHTGSAEGGIAASLGNEEKDQWDWHFFDTIKGSDWLADQDAAEILAREAAQTVIRLEHDGVAFSRRSDGHIAQRRFGGHTSEFGEKPVRRTAYAADRIGHQILHSLWQQCVQEGVQFAEEWYVTDLVLSHGDSQKNSDSKNDYNEDSYVNGVIVLDTHSGDIHALNSARVVLATGGAGRLFYTTSNSWDLTGDGMGLVLNAGLQLEDIEFMQFHPTGLAHTGILLSEASRGEGGILRNSQGEAFMKRYAPHQADLAARDVVTRSIMAEIDEGRGVADPLDPTGPRDCVWLDLTEIDDDILEEKLPEVVSIIRRYAGRNPHTEFVPVKPTAHYTMGGIPITTNGEVYAYTNGEQHIVKGLYAAGECSCVSVHGANRLGANSLLDACVFGTRAGHSAFKNWASDSESHSDSDESYESAPNLENKAESVIETIKKQRKAAIKALLTLNTEDTKADVEADAHAEVNEELNNNKSDNPYKLMADLGAMMETSFAVRCTQESIDKAISIIEESYIPRANALVSSSDSAAFNQELTSILEVRNLLAVAYAMLDSASQRHESRGSLQRFDFPERDDTNFLKHSMVNNNHEVTYKDVVITRFQPQKRSY